MTRVYAKFITHLHNHHVAIESATTAGFGGTVDAATDLRYNGAADGHIWDEVTVHNVDMQPVCALLHLPGAVMAQIGEVGAENGGRDDSWRCHDVYVWGRRVGEKLGRIWRGGGVIKKKKIEIDLKLLRCLHQWRREWICRVHRKSRNIRSTLTCTIQFSFLSFHLFIFSLFSSLKSRTSSGPSPSRYCCDAIDKGSGSHVLGSRYTILPKDTFNLILIDDRSLSKKGGSASFKTLHSG